MAQLNLYKAVEAVITSAKEGIVSFADGDEQRMMLSGLRRFTKYTNQPNVIALTEKIAETFCREKILTKNLLIQFYSKTASILEAVFV